MEAEDRGWYDGPDRFVCAECADDEFLAAMVEAELVEPECDYCGAVSPDGTPIAAPVGVLIAGVGRAVNWYWTDPAEELPYESREGGYQGEVIDSADLLAHHIGVSWEEALLYDVAGCLANEHWCKRDYFTLEQDDRLRHGWRKFEQTTKHRSRYAALLPPLKSDEFVHPDDVPTDTMLGEVANCIHVSGLITTLPVSTTFFRARVHSPTETLNTATDLGAPRPDQAMYANRMSAAGIAVFYGAMEEQTALIETFDPRKRKRRVATTARFESLRDVRVLNLCDLPAIPSYFDIDNETRRYATIFLYRFAVAVSEPTTKDGREHIDYVPTQIFAEYIRHRLKVAGGGDIHGIMYPSAQAPGGRCCALFCDQSACVEPEGLELMHAEQWLRLDPASVTVHDEDACRLAVRRARRRALVLRKRRRFGF